MQARARRMTLTTALATLACASLAIAPARAGTLKHVFKHSHRHEGSGNVVTRTLDVKGFTAIDVQGVADVRVRFGDDFRAELSAEDNLIDLVRVHVKGSRLVVDMDDDDDFDTEEGVHLDVVMPRLESVVVHGVSNVDVSDFDGDRLALELHGVGNIEVDGKVRRLDAELGGVGKIDLRDLVAADATVHAGGIGEVLVNCEGVLDAHVNGMSKVRYYGTPREVHDDVDGLGSLRQASR